MQATALEVFQSLGLGPKHLPTFKKEYIYYMSQISPTQFAIFQSDSGTLKCYVSFRIVDITQVFTDLSV